MVMTNSLMAHEQKTHKNFWLDIRHEFVTLMKKSYVPPQSDVHTSEDIHRKMIKKFPLTLSIWLYATLYTLGKNP